MKRKYVVTLDDGRDQVVTSLISLEKGNVILRIHYCMYTIKLLYLQNFLECYWTIFMLPRGRKLKKTCNIMDSPQDITDSGTGSDYVNY